MIAPRMSGCALRRGASPAGSERQATNRASPASGRFTRKMSRQSTAESSPPRSGPIAAPMLVVAPEIPKYVPALPSIDSPRRSARLFGTTDAAARACWRRNATSTTRFGASAAPTDATMKYTSAPSMKRRRPNRSPSRPAIGWSDAIAMRYDVTSQASVTGSAPRSRPMSGSATTIIVEFSGTRRLPRATAKTKAGTRGARTMKV